MEEKNSKVKIILLLFAIVLTLSFHTLGGIVPVNANSIIPAIRRVTLAKGQRKDASAVYKNSENFDVEISVKAYSYNPQTDEIAEDKNEIFIIPDVDTISVAANSSSTIKYEISPIANIREGTYFNIITLTPIGQNQVVEINASIAQLIILDVVSENGEITGITTEAYTSNIQIVKKGIPFVSPLIIKSSVQNHSNYVLTPQGRIDVFNERNTYKPTYEYINRNERELYPDEVLEEEFSISSWHISDIFNKRVIQAEIYNGLDSNPQKVELEINSYLPEFFVSLTVIVISIIILKYIKQDKEKKRKKSESKVKKSKKG